MMPCPPPPRRQPDKKGRDGEEEQKELDVILVEQIPDADRWQKVRQLAKYVHILIKFNSGITTRAQELSGIGFTAYDALHIACAEEAAVDVFLTTDDRLIKLADRYPGKIQVRVCNPLPWIGEVMKV